MRRPFRLTILLVLAPILLLAPVYLTGKAIFWGTPLLQFVPWRIWAWETLQQGNLPLWNPLLGMGAPLIANYQSALFYPPNWLYFLAAAIGGVSALVWIQSLIIVLHLILAAIGMAGFARWLGIDELGQTISGLAFGLSGYLVTRAGFLSVNAASAWLPWVMLGVGRLYEQRQYPWRKKLRAVLFLGLAFGIQLLAGHAQTAWYTLLFAAAWGIYLAAAGIKWRGAAQENQGVAHSQYGNRLNSLNSVKNIKELTSWALLLGLSLAFAVGLAAVQLFPTAEYLLQSQRSSAVGYEFAMTYSFWPWRLLSFLAPSLFGDPLVGDYWGYANFWEDAVYIGLIPFLCALRVIFGFIRRKKFEGSSLKQPLRGLIGFFLGATIIAVFLALGSNTPIFPWLYRHIPTFDMFQAPTRYSIVAEFSLAVLAGIGVSRLRRPSGRTLYWARLGTAGAFAVMLGAGLAWLLMGSISPSFIRATALAGGIGCLFGFLILRGPERQEFDDQAQPFGYVGWSWALSIVVAGDLLVAGWGMNPGVETTIYQENPLESGLIQDLAPGGRLYLPAKDEESLKFDRFFQFESFNLRYAGDTWYEVRSSFLPNVSLLDGIPSANNFDPLVPGRFDQWMDSLEQANGPQRERMLNLMAVKVVEKVDHTDPRLVIFQSRESLPRLRWVSCGLSSGSGTESLDLVQGESWSLDEAVVLEGSGSELDQDCSPSAEARIDLLSESPNHLVLNVNATTPGYLVQADVWYPGWQASIDGQPVDILQANYLFRAIPAPAGEHTITLSYKPVSFYAGVVLSLITLCGLIVGGYLSRGF